MLPPPGRRERVAEQRVEKGAGHQDEAHESVGLPLSPPIVALRTDHADGPAEGFPIGHRSEAGLLPRPGDRRVPVTEYAFSPHEAAIVTGAQLAGIVGEGVAGRLERGFAAADAGPDGARSVDLGEDRLAVVAALRELSADHSDATELQTTEELIKALTSL